MVIEEIVSQENVYFSNKPIHFHIHWLTLFMDLIKRILNFSLIKRKPELTLRLIIISDFSPRQ